MNLQFNILLIINEDMILFILMNNLIILNVALIMAGKLKENH